MSAPPRPEKPDADLVRFASSVRRARRLHRAAGLATLALLCVGAIAPLALPSPPPQIRWSRPGRLPVQASVLFPGMCGPDPSDSPDTRFALAVAGLDQCPWF
jgi:hypothetical protein